MRTVEGGFATARLRFAIVVARFNELVTAQLLKGALDGLDRHGVAKRNITVAHVPGSIEIPLTAKRLSQTGKYHAVICLGCVIRGSTAHFDHVAGQAAAGIAQVALETGVPTIFGVLTTENLEQALERAGTKGGNRGFDAALAAIEMANLFNKIELAQQKAPRRPTLPAKRRASKRRRK